MIQILPGIHFHPSAVVGYKATDKAEPRSLSERDEVYVPVYNLTVYVLGSPPITHTFEDKRTRNTYINRLRNAR